MDLGIEGNFWIHQDFINEKIHPNWVIDQNQNLVKLAKISGSSTVVMINY